MNDPVDHGAAPQFLDLWPTQPMLIRLRGADTANPVLACVLMERNVGLEDITVDYTSDCAWQVFWLTVIGFMCLPSRVSQWRV